MKAPVLSVLLAASLLAAGSASAQPSEERRGGIPPGSAADGSRPAEGAITGSAPPERLPIEKRVERCQTLSGPLREQCLRDAMNPSSGATRPPRSTHEATRPLPPDAPPPQNPVR